MRTRSSLLIAYAAVAVAFGSALGTGAPASPAGPVADTVTRPVTPAAYLTKHHHHDDGDGDGRKKQSNALKYLHDDFGSDYDFNANYPTGPNPLASPPPPVRPAPPPAPVVAPPASAPSPGQ